MDELRQAVTAPILREDQGPAPSTGAFLTIRELIKRPPVVVFEDHSLCEAADHMGHEKVGHLPVVTREDPSRPVGMLTRSDRLSAHQRRLDETHHGKRSIRVRKLPMERFGRNGHAPNGKT